MGIIIPDKRVSSCTIGSAALIAGSSSSTASNTAASVAGHKSSKSLSSCGSSPSGEESLPSPLNELNTRPGNDVPSTAMLTTISPDVVTTAATNASGAALSEPATTPMSSCHVQQQSTFLHTKMKHSYAGKSKSTASKCSHARHVTKAQQQNQHAACHHCSCCCSSGGISPAGPMSSGTAAAGIMMGEEEVSTSAQSPAESSAGHGSWNRSSTVTKTSSVYAGKASSSCASTSRSSPLSSTPPPLLLSSASSSLSSSSWRAGFCRQRPYPSVR